MSQVIAPVSAVVIAVLLQVAIGVRDIFALHGQYDMRALLRLSAGAVAGTPLGVLLLTRMDANAARIAIAVVVILGLAFLLRKPRTLSEPRPAVTYGVGGLSGLFSGLAAMPGPPAVAYFLATDTPPLVARATLMMFFFVAALLACPGLMQAGVIGAGELWLTLFSIPVLLIGTWLGAWTFQRLRSGQYRTMALAVMALSAGLAGWRGVAGYFA